MIVYYVLYFSVPEFTCNKSKMILKTKTGPTFCFPSSFPLFSGPGYGLLVVGASHINNPHVSFLDCQPPHTITFMLFS